MPSDCPSKHAGHNRCQDKTKGSEYASLNTGLYGRYRFGSGYSCPASVHRQRNFTPNRGTLLMYCNLSTLTMITTTLLSLTSLFHLALISVERLIAMKYSLRYNDIVTKRRLTAAVALCWLFAAINLTIRLTVTRITDVFVMIITPMIFTVIFQFILFVVAI